MCMSPDPCQLSTKSVMTLQWYVCLRRGLGDDDDGCVYSWGC